MKKLWFLVPVCTWGITYFTFPLANPNTATGTWWVLTNLALFFISVGSLVLAVAINLDDV